MTIRPRSSLLNPALVRPHALSSVPRDRQAFWLDKNENLDPTLLSLSAKVFAEMDAASIASYPEAGELYRRLAAWVALDPHCLLLTPGSDGAIRLTFEALVEPGDVVVHTLPTFAMYPVYCQMFGAAAVAIDYLESDSGPKLNRDALIEAVRHYKPKLVCLPNPDSPTGTVQDESFLSDLLRACEEGGSVLLIDEAYHPFYRWTAIPWVMKSPNLVVARTFAKAWGAAGLRIGYLAAHPTTSALLHKLRPMYEVSTVGTEFMTRMMDHADAIEASVQRVLEGKVQFAMRMERLGLRVLRSEGNFMHVQFGAYAERVHAVLRGKVLYREAFTTPGLFGYSRFSMAPIGVLEPVIQLIENVVGEAR